MLLHLVLFEPEIPPNTGNIIRLCANSGFSLHLIKPLGFDLDEKRLRRAGLDYHERIQLRAWDSLAEFLSTIKPPRTFALTTKGQFWYTTPDYQPEDALLLGPETRGLPASVLAQIPESQKLCIPMQPGSRSLNLSNAAAIVLYEAWRQLAFIGADGYSKLP